MKKFEYSKTEYEKICEECMLNDDERTILKLRCQGKSRQERKSCVDALAAATILQAHLNDINKNK